MAETSAASSNPSGQKDKPPVPAPNNASSIAHQRKYSLRTYSSDWGSAGKRVDETLNSYYLYNRPSLGDIWGRGVTDSYTPKLQGLKTTGGSFADGINSSNRGQSWFQNNNISNANNNLSNIHNANNYKSNSNLRESELYQARPSATNFEANSAVAWQRRSLPPRFRNDAPWTRYSGVTGGILNSCINHGSAYFDHNQQQQQQQQQYNTDLYGYAYNNPALNLGSNQGYHPDFNPSSANFRTSQWALNHSIPYSQSTAQPNPTPQHHYFGGYNEQTAQNKHFAPTGQPPLPPTELHVTEDMQYGGTGLLNTIRPVNNSLLTTVPNHQRFGTAFGAINPGLFGGRPLNPLNLSTSPPLTDDNTLAYGTVESGSANASSLRSKRRLRIWVMLCIIIIIVAVVVAMGVAVYSQVRTHNATVRKFYRQYNGKFLVLDSTAYLNLDPQLLDVASDTFRHASFYLNQKIDTAIRKSHLAPVYEESEIYRFRIIPAIPALEVHFHLRLSVHAEVSSFEILQILDEAVRKDEPGIFRDVEVDAASLSIEDQTLPPPFI